MKLVNAIEAVVGSTVEAWPTSDLIILFAFDPTMPFALTNLRRLCVLYGNNVPWGLACQFFAACSYHPPSPCHTTVQLFILHVVTVSSIALQMSILWSSCRSFQIHWLDVYDSICRRRNHLWLWENGFPIASPKHSDPSKPDGLCRGGGVTVMYSWCNISFSNISRFVFLQSSFSFIFLMHVSALSTSGLPIFWNCYFVKTLPHRIFIT